MLGPERWLSHYVVTLKSVSRFPPEDYCYPLSTPLGMPQKFAADISNSVAANSPINPTLQRNKPMLWIALQLTEQQDKYLLMSCFQQPCERGTNVIFLSTKMGPRLRRSHALPKDGNSVRSGTVLRRHRGSAPKSWHFLLFHKGNPPHIRKK